MHKHPNITLEGSNAGPDRGMVYYNGLPLCDDDSANEDSWDLNDATVVCRMLGFSTAKKHYIEFQGAPWTFCPPVGTPFAMSGFKCTGRETSILDCPHDATVSTWCGSTVSSYLGSSGVTDDGADIVGVECE